MACATSECNECGWYGANMFLDTCPKCGSTNVDREYDPSDWEEIEREDEDYFEEE